MPSAVTWALVAGTRLSANAPMSASRARRRGRIPSRRERGLAVLGQRRRMLGSLAAATRHECGACSMISASGGGRLGRPMTTSMPTAARRSAPAATRRGCGLRHGGQLAENEAERDDVIALGRAGVHQGSAGDDSADAVPVERFRGSQSRAGRSLRSDGHHHGDGDVAAPRPGRTRASTGDGRVQVECAAIGEQVKARASRTPSGRRTRWRGCPAAKAQARRRRPSRRHRLMGQAAVKPRR